MIIKFSHFYTKMVRDYQQSKLLDVLPVKLEDLSPDFLLYDTAYEEAGEIKYYPLPKNGNYMVLLLQAGAGKGKLWTTIRSQRGKFGIDKMQYYRDHIGEVCECRVVA
ncbi:hypothetical protein M0R72_19150 [Candidatus Pacearchaeota archaeon]|jgi:hypothetical protein|nr:hypothetical protein [Candidatus Pacearchaeota archaeon]